MEAGSAEPHGSVLRAARQCRELPSFPPLDKQVLRGALHWRLAHIAGANRASWTVPTTRALLSAGDSRAIIPDPILSASCPYRCIGPCWQEVGSRALQPEGPAGKGWVRIGSAHSSCPGGQGGSSRVSCSCQLPPTHCADALRSERAEEPTAPTVQRGVGAGRNGACSSLLC